MMGLAGNGLASRPRASSAGGGSGGRRGGGGAQASGALPLAHQQHGARHVFGSSNGSGGLSSSLLPLPLPLLLPRGAGPVAGRALGAALAALALLLTVAVLRGGGGGGGGLLLLGSAGRRAADDAERPWLTMMVAAPGGERLRGAAGAMTATAGAGATADAAAARAAYVARERLHRAIAEECARGEDTVIRLDGGGGGGVLVEQAVDYGYCPLMDIMLRGSERGIGMCTDAALYVAALGARLLPAGAAGPRYDAACGARTARLFLETMYSEFVAPPPPPPPPPPPGPGGSGGGSAGGSGSDGGGGGKGGGGPPGVLHLQLVNNEHLWAADEALHARMGAFLCKTRFCAGLMRAHVAARGWAAEVRLMGHTSLDPGVDAPAGVTRDDRAAAPPPFLHVKGKSGLKHTRELLECWAKRPDLPTLHVVGRFAWKEVEGAAAAAANIRFYPRVGPDAAGGGPDRQTEHVSFADVRRLQLEMPVHVCTSEREGFGHYINEARAAAAAVLSTDHPPMNELVPPAAGGLLVAPARTGSYAEQALGRYAPLNAYLAPDAICAGAAALARLSRAELARRGRAARAAYLADRAAFLAAAEELRAALEARRARLAGEGGGGGGGGGLASSDSAGGIGIGIGSGSTNSTSSSSAWGGPDSAAVLYVQQQQREHEQEEQHKKKQQQP